MHVYLAGCYGRPFVITEQFSTMDFYIGAPHSEIRHPDLEECYGNAETQVDEKLYILESFYYVEKWMIPYIRNKVWNFMLDSEERLSLRKAARATTGSVASSREM